VAGLLTLAFETRSDPDLWGHVRFGQDLRHHGQLPAADPYSFTADRRWVNHEWLAEAIMGAAYDAGGPGGLVAVKWLLVAIATGVGCQRLLAWFSPVGLALPALALAVVMGVLPLAQTFRPHTFSVALFALTLAALAAAERRWQRAWWLLPLAALWANLHGGWLVGLGTVGAWATGRLAFDAAIARRERLWLGVPVLAAVAATLLTPYGLELWRFLAGTVRLARPDIPEWWPLERQPILFVPWALTSIVGVAAVVRAGRAASGMAVAAVFLAVASWRVGRVVPFYSLVVWLGLVPLALDAFGRSRPAGRRVHPAVFMAGAAIALVVELTRGAPSSCLVPAPPFSIDAGAARFIARHRLAGRLVVWFDWGEYVIWHHGPRLRVSIDGRRETVYSQTFRDRHDAFNRGDDSGEAFLADLDPDYLWLPHALPVTARLPSWGYAPIFQGDASAVWARTSDTREYGAGSEPAGEQCFPGPP
jgi:hypothetical protein